jgi:hypothetical protein
MSVPGDYDNGEIGGMIGRGNRSTRRKPAPVPLCPPETPHAARTRTRVAAVGSQRLTAELRHGLYLTNNLELKRGFIRERLCADAIFMLKQMIEHSTEFLGSVDLRKFFDKVKLEDILDILKKENLPGNIINFIKEIYTENQVLIKSESGIARDLLIKKGTREENL